MAGFTQVFVPGEIDPIVHWGAPVLSGLHEEEGAAGPPAACRPSIAHFAFPAAGGRRRPDGA